MVWEESKLVLFLEIDIRFGKDLGMENLLKRKLIIQKKDLLKALLSFFCCSFVVAICKNLFALMACSENCMFKKKSSESGSRQTISSWCFIFFFTWCDCCHEMCVCNLRSNHIAYIQCKHCDISFYLQIFDRFFLCRIVLHVLTYLNTWSTFLSASSNPIVSINADFFFFICYSSNKTYFERWWMCM